MGRILAVFALAVVVFALFVFGLSAVGGTWSHPSAAVGLIQVALMAVVVEAARPTRPPAI